MSRAEPYGHVKYKDWKIEDMNSEKLNLVPQIVIDVAEAAHKNKNPFTRDVYVQRLEAIRDYCVEVLGKIAEKQDA